MTVTVSGLGLQGTHVAYRELDATRQTGAVPGLTRLLRYTLSATGPAVIGAQAVPRQAHQGRGSSSDHPGHEGNASAHHNRQRDRDRDRDTTTVG